MVYSSVKELETGTMVKFQLEDVISPELIFVVKNITRQLELTGKVLFLSDSGQQKNHYAVLEVAGVRSPVVVPVRNLAVNPMTRL